MGKLKSLGLIISSYIVAVAFSLILSIAAFSYCKAEFEKLKIVEKNVTISISSNVEGEPDISQIPTFIAKTNCVRKHLTDGYDCNKNNNITATETNEINSVFGEIGKNSLILFIEKLLIAGLAVQLFLTIYTLFLEKIPSFDPYVFHLSDWAINTPPILGVLANLVSFSLLLSRNENIQSVFSGYFFQAVITTLIGGVFYIINLALKIIIHPRIEQYT